jgi:hypothetical protein
MKMKISAATTFVTMIGLLCLTGSQRQNTCVTTIRLTDSVTGDELSGLLKITDSDGQAVLPGELLSRGFGLDDTLPISRWSVLPGQRSVKLPRKNLTVEAISGLETEQVKVTVDLTGKTTVKVSIPLTRFYRASSQGLRSANTHLHLQKITREDCDRYLLEIPKADGLDALFLSYLERAGADREYTSNKYTDGHLTSLTKKSGISFGNGEEHRHNFAGFGQGFGHVMLLNIKKLIQPVSIGPGIMKIGTDGIPLRRGIDTAQNDGATVVWCHNDWGMEAVPNFLLGQVDAQNIFDGSVLSSYKDSFYRYLNAGIRVPFSTGTDWLMYDFSRVYCDLDGDITVQKWLDSLVAGKNYITNGPFLEFRVAGKTMGETLRLDKAQAVKITARALGRSDFKRIELIQNGKVVSKKASRPVGGHYESELELDFKINTPSWLALRTPPPSVKDDSQLSEPANTNVLGKELFAHTSAVYVEVAGRIRFDKTVAETLIAEMKTNRTFISDNGTFADNQERARVLDVYTDGIAAMKKLIKKNRR